MGDRLSALVRGYYEQVCLDVGLHAYQIGHPQQAGVDRRGVLNLVPEKERAVAEIARMLRRELDFGREERNLSQFGLFFEDETTVRIPQPFTEFCTPRVLTMEWMEGLNMASTIFRAWSRTAIMMPTIAMPNAPAISFATIARITDAMPIAMRRA